MIGYMVDFTSYYVNHIILNDKDIYKTVHINSI